MRPLGRDQGPRFPRPRPAESLREEPKLDELHAKREAKRLAEIAEATDNGRRLASVEQLHPEPPVSIDAVAKETAERWLSDVYLRLDQAESLLSMLGSFMGEETLGGSVVGSIGNDLGELREKLPSVREALKGLEGGDV
jgi:hypothetical protein